ncbi:hypothetical protein DYBT9275_02327 [Dyadobacter sp. CECT 9275]|uniref:Uncharacterized protein n=1 Tax=Dyadobacter helix TaxID=2822344 RepID=A0A916N5T8_9BACT|nr:hypothetical protein [Dyadobacter sp. CECT 9275]CAG4999856.1 hypothetical protein DYBT9275_02327 [Dyadobacter sp. CECT 9275]
MRYSTLTLFILLGGLLNSWTVSGQKKKDEFLISIYFPPPADFLNDTQYRYLKEGNVDIVFNTGPGVTSDKKGNLQTLDMAHKHGLKVYVHDVRLSQSDDKIREMVNDYKAHPALGGYYITDEPDTARLKSATELLKKVKALDPAKDSYINHLPDWAIEEKESYEHSFLKRYIELAGRGNLNYLAYDNYPFKRKQRLEKTYFNNLEVIRRVGLKYDIKTSSCLQSFGMYFSGVEELRRPNVDEMRMNVFSNLAYGIKNPVWFPYWSATKLGGTLTFSTSMIDSTGVKTDFYEPFRELNSQMKQLGKTLIHLDARQVYHTGDSLWIGTVSPPADFIAQIDDKKAELILTRFTDKTSDKQYLMVVNRSFKKSQPVTVMLNGSVRKVKEISKTTGKPVQAPFDPKNHRLTETFLPGEGRLYTLQ